MGRDISFLDEIKAFKNLINIFSKEKPDIIHLNSSKIGGLGSLAGRIAGVKKIIFTAHGFAFNEDRPYWQRLIIKFISFMTVVMSHETIVISKKELEQVSRWPLVSKKFTLIYNGISKIEFLNQDDARKFLLKKIDSAPSTVNFEDCIWVGTISELTKNKGLKYAIEAIGRLKKSLGDDWDGVFIIIGSGEDRGYLENLIEKENLEKNVFLTGFIEDAKIYLKAFDIFLLSSVKEGFPFTLLEAGQAENTIISTRVGGTEEIIDNLKNGVIVRAKTEKEIANAIRFYLENKNEVADFGKKIKIKVMEEFSLEKMAWETLAVYEG